jgi:hypothetical protein
MWTHFYDMHSGGGTKEPPYEHIYIEAPEDEACVVFYNRFGHSPHRITCTCCGNDYSVSEHETLEDATAYQRNCYWDEARLEWVELWEGRLNQPIIPMGMYMQKGDILIITKLAIKSHEREGGVPRSGWIWVGE